MKGRVTVSVVVPMYNEEENVDVTMTRLVEILNSCELIREWEMIVVDDGSLDNTLKAVEKYAENDSRIRVLRHPTNLGLGKALETGFREASKEIIISIDADLSYNPADIPRLISPLLRQPHVDVVVGSPYAGKGLTKDVSIFRIILSKSVNFLYRWIGGIPLTCYTSIFRAYRSSAVKNLTIESCRFEAQPEILFKIAQKGCVIKEIPVTLGKRRRGESKIVLWREVVLHLKLLTRFAFRKLRRKMI